MKRLVFIMLISLLLVGTVNGQASEDTGNAFNVDMKVKYDKMQGLYGYVNSSGNWVIEPKFEYALEFSEGVAAVNTKESSWKFGYIRPDGSFAIECQFTRAYEFINGFAIVDKDGFAGIIDKSGNYILQTKYYLAGTSTIDTKVRAYVTDKNNATGTEVLKYGIITSEGKLIEPRFDGMPYLNGGFTCFYHEDETKEVDKRRAFIALSNGELVEYPGTISSVSEGVGLINYTVDKELNRANPSTRYAFITEDGRIIKEYITGSGEKLPFVKAYDFSEDVAAVAVNSTPKGSAYYDVWGFIKKDGTWLVKPGYKKAGSFKDGVAPVRDVYHWGYINKDLSWSIAKPEFTPAADTDEVLDEAISRQHYTQEEYDFTVNKAKEICSKIIKDSMSDYEKLVKIHDYIIENVKYDSYNFGNNNVPRVSFMAYGAFKYGQSVCEGYAETLGLMLTIAGVENKYISGEITSSGINHAWNLVSINGNYYHVDSTFNDSANTMRYFLASDELMSNDREWNSGLFPDAPNSYNK